MKGIVVERIVRVDEEGEYAFSTTRTSRGVLPRYWNLKLNDWGLDRTSTKFRKSTWSRYGLPHYQSSKHLLQPAYAAIGTRGARNGRAELQLGPRCGARVDKTRMTLQRFLELPPL